MRMSNKYHINNCIVRENDRYLAHKLDLVLSIGAVLLISQPGTVTGLPASSDSIGTVKKCHCKRGSAYSDTFLN